MATDAQDEPAQASELLAWIVRPARRAAARVQSEEAAVPESPARDAVVGSVDSVPEPMALGARDELAQVFEEQTAFAQVVGKYAVVRVL